VSVRWKTFARTEREFLTHLDGSFSSEYRAIPMRSLNVNTSREQVTFEIRSVSEIQSPSWPLVWLKLFRPQTLTLSVGPILVALAYIVQSGIPYNRSIALTSALGALLFHGSLNLLNDYYDHLKGRDRLNIKAGSRAIQKGWVRALDVKRFGFAMLALAILLGLPAIWEHLSLLLILAVLALLAGLEFSSQSLGLKYRGWAEPIVFLLTGPLLTLGFAWAITGEFLTSMIYLGVVFGIATLIVFHLSNLEEIMVDSQAGVKTLAVRLGFDRSQRVLWALAVLETSSILLFSCKVGFDSRSVLFTFAAMVLQGLFMYPMIWKVSSTRSPLASDLKDVRNYGLILHFWTALLLLFL
jgi:1,4-dihydroxy-2-naphthoate octaprenyltransferase